MRVNIKSTIIARIALVFILLLSVQVSKADEGMWLISLIQKNLESMQRMGLKLTAEDIYSINKSSLKDAVVQLDDGGCSAELISPFGLVLTNHHCAVSNIQSHSTSDRNLLHDGFWAMSRKEELPVPGKTALILKRVEDVTQQVLAKADFSSQEYFNQTAKACDEIVKSIEATEKGVHAQVVPMYNDNQFFLFVYNRFTDVRLVGAPPSSIGNFGGDVDNWRWPRHTGDFALYRIYTGPDGMPADYSKRNKPYVPKHHFPISLNGVNEDDFAMVLGYPGSTYRFSTSYHAKHERDVVAPWVDSVWGEFISSIKDAMQSDISKKVHFTDKHDMLVNFWQKDTYQASSMNRFGVVDRLEKREKALTEWANSDLDNRQQYINALSEIKDFYDLLRDNKYDELLRSIGSITNWPVEIGDKFYLLNDYFTEVMKEKPSKSKLKKELKRLKKELPSKYSSFYPDVDMKLYAAAFNSFIKHLPKDFNNPFFNELVGNENIELLMPILINHFYQSSYFSSQESLMKFLDKPVLDSLSRDPLFIIQVNLENLSFALRDSIAPHTQRLQKAMRDLSKGMLEMNNEKLLYPDANSTMRLSYGKVTGYYPRDGVKYRHQSYLDGVIEKENPNVDVFNVSSKIKELWKQKDFGPYADANGVPTCFLTDNDITNGNSGSPVLNAQGQLVGVAFDGNYEAMACDFMFEPSMQRTIVTDIRYVLFVIDKFAGAKHLVDEMTIIGKN
jgi:hypothetical protein